MKSDITRELLDRYAVLLDLYERMARVSDQVFEAIRNGADVSSLSDNLRENAEMADTIRAESERIVTLKKELADAALSDRDRSMVREAEQRLSRVVEQVVTTEKQSRERIMKDGMKVKRR